jgi:hypothetical protein
MAIREMNNTGLFRVKTAHRAAGTWAVSADFSVVASLVDGLFVLPLNGRLGLPDNRIFVSGGAGTANQTVSGRLLSIDRVSPGLDEPRPVSGVNDQFILKRVATFDAIIGTGAGIASGPVLDTDRLADNVNTWTLTAWGTYLQTLYGITFGTLDPDDNTFASIGIQDGCDRYGYAFDFDTTAAAAVTGINMLSQKGGA